MTTFNEEPFISVRKITQQFGSQRVLKGVSFDMYRGELLALVGGSGAGKSVILKHLTGLLDPISGEVYVNGRLMSNVPEREKSKLRGEIGIMFQSGALFDSMSVYENVAFPLREKGMRDEDVIGEKVRAALESVYLGESGKKMPSELSGGMIKRVALARAIITEPECLLYDEPTAGLDPIVTDSISYLIREINKEKKKATIVVSHDMPSVFKMADRIIYLRNGSVYWTGTPKEFMESEDPVCSRFLHGNSGEDWEKFSPEISLSLLGNPKADNKVEQ